MRLDGGCACGSVRYVLDNEPLVVHACHCRDCQLLSGTAFATNAWIMRSDLEVLQGDLTAASFKAGSGKEHRVLRRSQCGTQLWSEYAGAFPGTVFLRVGTLDEPRSLQPDIHIFTRSKQPWITLPPDVPAFETFYPIQATWKPESLARVGLKTQ